MRNEKNTDEKYLTSVKNNLPGRTPITKNFTSRIKKHKQILLVFILF